MVSEAAEKSRAKADTGGCGFHGVVPGMRRGRVDEVTVPVCDREVSNGLVGGFRGKVARSRWFGAARLRSGRDDKFKG